MKILPNWNIWMVFFVREMTFFEEIVSSLYRIHKTSRISDFLYEMTICFSCKTRRDSNKCMGSFLVNIWAIFLSRFTAILIYYLLANFYGKIKRKKRRYILCRIGKIFGVEKIYITYNKFWFLLQTNACIIYTILHILILIVILINVQDFYLKPLMSMQTAILYNS